MISITGYVQYAYDEADSNFRQKYLVNTPMPGRIQVYLNRKLYDEIKNYLHVIAPEVSIASYISNIIAEHITRYFTIG